MSIALENVRRDLRSRLESDRQMSGAWILIPLFQILTVIILVVVIIAVIFSAVLTAAASGTKINTATLAASPAFLGAIILAGVVGFILNIFYAFMLYYLVRRRNAHFSRQSLLYEDLERTARELAMKKSLDVTVSLNSLERLRRESRVEEPWRDQVLWSVVLFFAAGAAIPSATSLRTLTGVSFIASFAMYYVYYFLMKDMYKHERREDMFVDELSRLLVAVGINIALPRRTSPIPDRSFILYIVLTIVTLGFWGVYWVYVLLTDPNNHFRHQAMVEDTIIAQAAPLLA